MSFAENLRLTRKERNVSQGRISRNNGHKSSAYF